MIIWSNAAEFKDGIIERLNSEFTIHKIIKISWKKWDFLNNFSVFYSHSLRGYPNKRTRKILWHKLRDCGHGDFYAIIFKDISPKYETRETSSGERVVNIRVFDLKMDFRKMVGGGSRIHASDDAWETNKDLTLLFGLNTDDFLKQYPKSSSEIEFYKRDCIGVHGYSSINEFFYVLNNCIKYCVLRNYECLPEQYTIEGHGDIDLLVEDKRYMTRLTCARPSFPQPYRVYHTIRIAGRETPFDFRYVGDNYYDYRWEQAILEGRIFHKELFYAPDVENHYYSLLYHAYVQKKKVNSSYPPVLDALSRQVGIGFKEDKDIVVSQLDAFMASKGYFYTKAKDLSVYFNKNFIEKSVYCKERGYTIKTLFIFNNGKREFVSSVNELGDRYIKRGRVNQLLNEKEKLMRLSQVEGFPAIIEKNIASDALCLSKVEGLNADTFWDNPNNYTFKLCSSFIIGLLGILGKLRERGIIHRDVQPSNILVNKYDGICQVGLIDFGWAIFDDEIHNCEKPHNLGKYRGHQYTGELNQLTDYYSLCEIVERYWSIVPCYRKFSMNLRKQLTSSEGLKESLELENLIEKLSPNVVDNLFLYILRQYVRMKNVLRKKNSLLSFYLKIFGE